ncbi:hypothetical protein YC2023_053427 [Brassica napus]
MSEKLKEKVDLEIARVAQEMKHKLKIATVAMVVVGAIVGIWTSLSAYRTNPILPGCHSTSLLSLKPNIDVRIESRTLTTALGRVYIFTTSKNAEALPPTQPNDHHRRWDQALLRLTIPTSNPFPSSSSTKETNLLSVTHCTTPPTISRSQGKEDPGHGDVSPKPHPSSGGLSCRSKMGEVRSSQTLGSKIRPSPPPSSLGLAVTLEKPVSIPVDLEESPEGNRQLKASCIST